MRAQLRPELDVDGEQSGQLFLPADDPVAPVGVVLAGERIQTTEKHLADTAGRAVIDTLAKPAQQFATSARNHDRISFVLHATVCAVWWRARSE
jgi:hypothetical protein